MLLIILTNKRFSIFNNQYYPLLLLPIIFGILVIIPQASADTVVSTINVGSNAQGLAYDPAKGEIFVANAGSNTISVISDATNSVTATLTGFNGPIGVAYDPAKGEIFVTVSGAISVINDTNNSIVVTITDGNTPMAVAYDPAKGRYLLQMINTPLDLSP